MTSSYPPGPPPLRSLAFVTARRRGFASVATFLEETARRYGPIAHWAVGPRHLYLLDDPHLIEELLVSRARDFVKGVGAQRLRLVMGEGLVTSEEPLHLRQRRMMQPAFHRDRVAVYARQMVELARAWSEHLRDGDVVEIDAEMAKLALEIVTATMFGGATRQTADARKALGDLQPHLAATLGPVTQFLPTPVVERLMERLSILPPARHFVDARRRLDAIVYGLIEERAAAADRGDLLSMLLAARDESGAPMSRRQIRDEALTILLAGHETTAIALTWTWYLLALHPEIDAKLHDEIVRVCGDRDPAPSEAASLAYVRDVLAEAMRLYPPVWNIVRRAAKETQLGDWRIRKGATVMASPLVTHRNPHLWRDAAAFRPERWAEESRTLPRFAYFPFGGGNRVCIGESFAWTEAVLVLATLARRRRFALADPMPVAVNPMVTLRPARPVRMLVLARQPSLARF
jgi:cytochrome P450